MHRERLQRYRDHPQNEVEDVILIPHLLRKRVVIIGDTGVLIDTDTAALDYPIKGRLAIRSKRHLGQDYFCREQVWQEETARNPHLHLFFASLRDKFCAACVHCSPRTLGGGSNALYP